MAQDDTTGTGDGVVVLTGAAGRIGTYLRRAEGGLPARGWRLRLVDARPPEGDDADRADATRVVDLTDELAIEALAPLMSGADAVVHLAGIPHDDTWTSIRRANIDGTYRVLEAARRAGVRRAVLASSNHAVGYYLAQPDAPVDGPARPDSLYGVSKAALEALGALYVDRHGLEVVSLRIGFCSDAPKDTFDLATWLSPGDAVRLVDAALRGPVDGPTVVYGISGNTRAWWDLGSARRLGYAPQDDAERFADVVAPYDGPELLGGSATAP